MIELTNLDISLPFSVHTVDCICRTLTELCIFCNSMAPRDHNLIKHLKLALERLEQSSAETIYAIEEETFDVLEKISGLLLKLTAPGS